MKSLVLRSSIPDTKVADVFSIYKDTLAACRDDKIFSWVWDTDPSKRKAAWVTGTIGRTFKTGSPNYQAEVVLQKKGHFDLNIITHEDTFINAKQIFDNEIASVEKKLKRKDHITQWSNSPELKYRIFSLLTTQFLVASACVFFYSVNGLELILSPVPFGCMVVFGCLTLAKMIGFYVNSDDDY